MKFKATVRDQRTLASVCQACRGIQRRCVIKLHPTRIRFFTSTQFADGMQVWAGCRTQAIFSDFQSQSQLQENAIFCEVADISQLFHIMRQAERCPNVTIKLTKNAARRPALRVSMQGVRPHLDISHDVPVRVLSELEVRNISAPPLESEVVQIVLPCLAELSKFVDKVRSTSCDRMTFAVRDNERADGAAATSCTLVVLAECFLASFALKYSSVQKCEREGENDADFDGEGDGNGGDKPKHRDDTSMAYASVSVEVRRFARFLAIKEGHPSRLCCILWMGRRCAKRFCVRWHNARWLHACRGAIISAFALLLLAITGNWQSLSFDSMCCIVSPRSVCMRAHPTCTCICVFVAYKMQLIHNFRRERRGNCFTSAWHYRFFCCFLCVCGIGWCVLSRGPASLLLLVFFFRCGTAMHGRSSRLDPFGGASRLTLCCAVGLWGRSCATTRGMMPAAQSARRTL
ncbi:hypothetical protein TcBrA4_0020610 [Trypanosoma cruzi]|nr:hypothetical protein TcBrA4_0020610 [Trypanosoma cruzi]